MTAPAVDGRAVEQAVALYGPRDPARIGGGKRRAPTSVRPDTIVREGRDAHGRRVKRIYRRNTVTGQIGGFEHYHPAGNNDAAMGTPCLTVRLSARQFGMTVDQLAACLEDMPVLQAKSRVTAAGILLP